MLSFKQGVQKWVRHGSIWRILAYLGISNALQSAQRPLLRQTLPGCQQRTLRFVSLVISDSCTCLGLSRIDPSPVGLKCLALSAPTLKEGPFDHLDSCQGCDKLWHDLIWFDWISLSPFMNSHNTILYASLIFSYSLTMITNYDKKCHKLLTNLSSGPSSPVAWETMRSGCDSATPTLQLYKDQCCITACSWNLAARKWSKGKEGLESACKIS